MKQYMLLFILTVTLFASDATIFHGKQDTSLDAASLSEILQIIVDHDSFAEYLHLELPEQQQLYLSRENLQGIVPAITVADKRVALVDSDSKMENLLILKSINFKSSSSGLVSFHYPIEGVRAFVKIEKYDGKWQVHEMITREQ